MQKYETDANRINGYGQAPTSNTTSSLTAEIYDTLSILIMITLMSKTPYGQDNNKIAFEINTDNKEVISRANKRPEPLNISETLVPEYDLWCLMWGQYKMASQICMDQRTPR